MNWIFTLAAFLIIVVNTFEKLGETLETMLNSVIITSDHGYNEIMTLPNKLRPFIKSKTIDLIHFYGSNDVTDITNRFQHFEFDYMWNCVKLGYNEHNGTVNICSLKPWNVITMKFFWQFFF